MKEIATPDQYSAVIFDVDGTLTPLRQGSTGAFTRQLLPGRKEAIARLNTPIALASNQGGVRKGLPIGTVHAHMRWLCREIGAVGYKFAIVPGPRKKPNPGMLLEWANELGIPAEEILFVGDAFSDQDAAISAGMNFQWPEVFFNRPITEITFRHYGSWALSPDRWVAPKNNTLPAHKPIGGLWASPLRSGETAWERWCKKRGHRMWLGDQIPKKTKKSPIFPLPHFDFRLRSDANIHIINGYRDLEVMPRTILGGREVIDFEAMVRDGVDGVYLTEEGQWETRVTVPYNLNGWDVESLLVLNVGVVIPIGESEEVSK